MQLSSDHLGATFAALADPTRRAILARLASGGETSVTKLAEPFEMSLPAVTKHLKVLRRRPDHWVARRNGGPAGWTQSRCGHLNSHSNAKTERITIALRFGACDVVFDRCPGMLACHHHHFLRVQHAFAVDNAAVKQHLSKTQVIGNRPKVQDPAQSDFGVLSRMSIYCARLPIWSSASSRARRVLFSGMTLNNVWGIFTISQTAVRKKSPSLLLLTFSVTGSKRCTRRAR
jgi:hypothetical protein